VRVTDTHTMGEYAGLTGKSFHTDGSAEAQIWAADGSRLLVQMSGIVWLPFRLDTATVNITRIEVPGTA
jgi:hypothetical protein